MYLYFHEKFENAFLDKITLFSQEEDTFNIQKSKLVIKDNKDKLFFKIEVSHYEEHQGWNFRNELSPVYTISDLPFYNTVEDKAKTNPELFHKGIIEVIKMYLKRECISHRKRTIYNHFSATPLSVLVADISLLTSKYENPKFIHQHLIRDKSN